MMKRISNDGFITLLLTVVVSFAISSCGSKPVNNEATLGSFETRTIDIKSQAMPLGKPVDAKANYQKFIQSTKNDTLKAQALERLADLQLENQQADVEDLEADVIAEKEANKQETAARKKESKARKSVLSKEKQTSSINPLLKNRRVRSKKIPEAPQDESSANYESVAKQYEDLLKRYPDKKGNDRLLYQLARAYDLGGQPKKSLKVLERIVKKYPRHKQIEEVQFRRGEILFSFKRYQNAADAYERVLINRDSAYYERALYKQGWALFKKGKLEPALVAFYQLLDLYYKEGKRTTGLSRGEEDAVQDTLRVMSLAFSFQEGSKSISKFSEEHGKRKYDEKIYKRLSDLYIEQERFGDAAESYAAFVESNPNSAQAPTFMIKVIEIYKSGGYAKALSKAKADFVTRYGASKNYWSRQPESLFKEVAPALKENLEDLANHYHSLGQKTKKSNHYKVAAHWYREYVNSFPGESKTAEMNFLLAESLNEMKSYREAAKEYEKTAYRYESHKNSAEAGYAAIIVRQRHVATLKGKEKQKQRVSTIKTSMAFADNFPNDKRATGVLLKTAEELLDMKKYGDASVVAQRITTSKKKVDKVSKEKAWAIIATAEFELGHHKNAELATTQTLKLLKPGDKNRKAHVERLAASIYKQGETAKKKGQLKEAADHFLRVGRLAPTSSIRSTAEYDAAAVLAQTNNWLSTISVLKAFIQNNPSHKFAQDAIVKLALAYEKQENWGAAAHTYEKIYRGEKNPEKKRVILWQTAEYYEKGKNNRSAVKNYKTYVSKYSKPLEQAIEARQRIADIYKVQKDFKSRHYWLAEIVKANDGKGSTDRTKYLAAMGSMELAEPKFKAYRLVKLVQPLKKNLKKKKILLKETIDAYTKAASYGVEEITTASTYRIAEIYNEFSKGLFDSERPKGLSSEELEQYDILLEEQAYPFEEKAIEIHETNAGRVIAGIYDQWIKKSFSALKNLRPVRYAKSEKSETFAIAIN